MFNGVFTQFLLVALAAILVVAAVIDVRTFTISNRLNLSVALLEPLSWLSIALPLWPGIGIQLPAGAGVFVLRAAA
jgi:prepilin peptidase CpaA